MRWRGNRKEPVADFFISRNEKLFEVCGQQIETLSMNGIVMKKSLFLELLNLMPNLVELHIEDCSFSGNGSIQLKMLKLKTLSLQRVSEHTELIDHIFCPSIQTFHYESYRNRLALSKFLGAAHKNLKEVKISSPCFRNGIIDNQSLEQLFQIDLKSLSLCDATRAQHVAALIERQPQLRSLAIRMNSPDDVESLRPIVKLQHLMSLQINVTRYVHVPVPKQLVCDILQMPKLKRLEIKTSFYNDFTRSMINIKNLQIESLRIHSEGFDQEVQQLASVFPNLKSLKVTGFRAKLSCLLRLEKLELLNILADTDGHGANTMMFRDMLAELKRNEFEKNESIRYMGGNLPPLMMTSLIQKTPNIERLKIKRHPSYQKITDITMRELFMKVLSLKNLVEIECANEILLNEGAVNCINHYPDLQCQTEPDSDCSIGTKLPSVGSSKLERITFSYEGEWQSVVATYEKKFPFKRLNFAKKKVTISRY